MFKVLQGLLYAIADEKFAFVLLSYGENDSLWSLWIYAAVTAHDHNGVPNRVVAKLLVGDALAYPPWTLKLTNRMHSTSNPSAGKWKLGGGPELT